MVENTALQNQPVVAQGSPDERVHFIRQVYTHVAGAWLAFFFLECVILSLPITDKFNGFVR